MLLEVFNYKVSIERFYVMENDLKEKVFRILVFCPLHVSVKLWYLFGPWSCATFFRSGILSVRETGGKQILSGNVVLVPVIVVWFRGPLTAILARRRAVVVCLLCICQWVHVLVLNEDGRYYVTFFHNMFVKFIHYLWSTVYDGVDLVFGIFANSLTSKGTHVVLIYQIGCFSASTSSLSWLRWWDRTRSCTLSRKEDKTEPLCCEIPKHVFWVLGIGILHVLR